MGTTCGILDLPTAVGSAAGTFHEGLAPRVGLPAWRTVRTFLAVGAVATVGYGLLYLGLRTSMAPAWANVVALVLSTLACTGAHRRYTFQVREPSSAAPHQALGLLVLVLGLGIPTGSVQVLPVFHLGADEVLELLVLCIANGVTGALRFGIFSVVIGPGSRVPTRPAATR